ncbi:MAG: AAA family ATPase [Desulfotomaculales bacterium]
MYITGVVLENFQSHVETTLSFTSGYNALFGECEAGKTAVWRALRWVIYNGREQAEPFVRAGAKYCRVSVSFSNGLAITRESTGRGSRYKLSQQGTVLSETTRYPLAFFRNAGLHPIRLADGLEVVLNLAPQTEALPFSPAPLWADLFERVTGRHILHAALAATRAELTKLRTPSPDGPGKTSKPAQRDRLKKVEAFLQEAVRFVADYDRRRVEKIVTYLMQYVFGESYRFKMRYTPRLQGIRFIIELRDGAGRVVNMPVTAGGGLADLAILAWRFALLEISRPPIRGPLVLDEPARNVSDAYISRVARLLKTLTDVFRRQIIITTNNQHLIGTADTLYIVRLENGVSKVHRR